MDSPRQAERFLRAFEDLLSVEESASRDRWLVRAAVASGAGSAAALWRRWPRDNHPGDTQSVEQANGWREVVAAGPRELLPSADEIDALLARAREGLLPSDRWILALHQGRISSAFVIAGLGSGEGVLDLVEASFRLLLLLDAADPAFNEPMRLRLSQVASPLPSAARSDLHAVEAALAEFARDIDGGESVLTRALEREVQRLLHRSRRSHESSP